MLLLQHSNGSKNSRDENQMLVGIPEEYYVVTVALLLCFPNVHLRNKPK